MVSLLLQTECPDVIVEECVTAEAAARLTGYDIQHVRRLTYAGKLEATQDGPVMAHQGQVHRSLSV